MKIKLNNSWHINNHVIKDRVLSFHVFEFIPDIFLEKSFISVLSVVFGKL